VIADLREWLDGIEERYGPNFAIEAYGFLGAVGFTPRGDEAPDDESFSDSAVGFWCSDGRHWAQVGLLRSALSSVESDRANPASEVIRKRSRTPRPSLKVVATNPWL
jgi:hypothetical protein